MPVESPKFDVSLRDLRHIRGVTGDLESRLASGAPEAWTMQIPRGRFTTRRLMAASAVVAGVMAVGRLNEFEASLFFAMCYFVVPPILVIMILRGFDPARPRR
jgi:hypothetical protein